MKALLGVPLAVGLALAVVAWDVVGRGDRTTLVPPPESVAEEFARALRAKRLDGARAFLSRGTAESLAPHDLERLASSVIARSSPVVQIEGAPIAMGRDDATARAAIATPRGDSLFLDVALIREDALWKIARWRLSSSESWPMDTKQSVAPAITIPSHYGPIWTIG